MAPLDPATPAPAPPPAPAGPPAADDDLERLGRRIRERRRELGMTLVQLAAAADLSHPFLSQLERARARPSLPSLQRIARALGTSQLELMQPPVTASRRVEVVQQDRGPQGPFGAGAARLLAHLDDRFHPMEFTDTDAEPGEYYVHAEAEFLYVLTGAVAVDLGEHATHELRTGDSVHYSGGVPHRWYSPEPGPVRILVVKHSLDGAAPSVSIDQR